MIKNIAYSIALVLAILLPSRIYADIYSINIKAIPGYNSIETQLNSLYENLRCYHIWYPKWEFDVPREVFIENLTNLYNDLIKIKKTSNDNIELELLMGEVAHFLYNLDIQNFYQKAIDHYKNAELINVVDYRPIWFHAWHLSLSSNPKTGIEKFKKISAGADPKNLFPLFGRSMHMHLVLLL